VIEDPDAKHPPADEHLLRRARSADGVPREPRRPSLPSFRVDVPGMALVHQL
jgi:hypothetical protein